jgi:hypothetical protein
LRGVQKAACLTKQCADDSVLAGCVILIVGIACLAQARRRGGGAFEHGAGVHDQRIFNDAEQ